jgi:hypothetical protein
VSFDTLAEHFRDIVGTKSVSNRLTSEGGTKAFVDFIFMGCHTHTLQNRLMAGIKSLPQYEAFKPGGIRFWAFCDVVPSDISMIVLESYDRYSRDLSAKGYEKITLGVKEDLELFHHIHNRCSTQNPPPCLERSPCMLGVRLPCGLISHIQTCF